MHQETKTTPFPEKEEYKGNSDYYESQLVEINLLTKSLELLKQENDRVQHLTQCLILQLGKVENNKFPLKEIDQQMKLFDDGGIDGTPRNA
jgi:hypothetical protein